MSLVSDSKTSGDPTYYDAGFLNVVADHITFLKKPGNSTQFTLNDEAIFMYRRDILRLFSAMGIPTQLNLVCMVLNGIKSPTQDISGFSFFYVPDTSVIAQLANSYKSTIG